jgi:hypothetical protein
MEMLQHSEIIQDSDGWDMLPEFTVVAEKEVKSPLQSDAVLTQSHSASSTVSSRSEEKVGPGYAIASAKAAHLLYGSSSKQKLETVLTRQIVGDQHGFLKSGGRVSAAFAIKDAKKRLSASGGRRKC